MALGALMALPPSLLPSSGPTGELDAQRLPGGSGWSLARTPKHPCFPGNRSAGAGREGMCGRRLAGLPQRNGLWLLFGDDSPQGQHLYLQP